MEKNETVKGATTNISEMFGEWLIPTSPESLHKEVFKKIRIPRKLKKRITNILAETTVSFYVDESIFIEVTVKWSQISGANRKRLASLFVEYHEVNIHNMYFLRFFEDRLRMILIDVCIKQYKLSVPAHEIVEYDIEPPNAQIMYVDMLYTSNTTN